MSKHREEMTVALPIAEARAACQAAVAGPGWTVAADGSDRLTCREIPKVMTWHNPVTVEIALAAADGGTRVSISGSNGGFGPIQSSHVKGKVRGLREGIAQAASRPAGPRTYSRAVVVNGERVSDETLADLARQIGLRVGDGNYWYDKVSGAWGLRGGPTRGFLPPGLPLGGLLTRDVSGGGTLVMVNGRELHPLDVLGLQWLIGMVLPGRWWTDAAGNFGREGGPAQGNLWALHRSRRGGRAGGGTAGESGPITTDGAGNMYFDKADTFGNYYSS